MRATNKRTDRVPAIRNDLLAAGCGRLDVDVGMAVVPAATTFDANAVTAVGILIYCRVNL